MLRRNTGLIDQRSQPQLPTVARSATVIIERTQLLKSVCCRVRAMLRHCADMAAVIFFLLKAAGKPAAVSA